MNDILNDKKKIAILFKKYVEIILNEYKDIIPLDIKKRLENVSDFQELVKIYNTNTISLFANKNDSTIHLPLDAYEAIKVLSTNPNYGSNRNHKTHDENNMIINDNTFRDFVSHIILKGATTCEYFEEILLHEVMHVCGSSGSYALDEGFNELKTRELALKYNLNTSCCGYPKETKIAYMLEQIFGKLVCDKLAFLDFNQRIKYLDSISSNLAQLYIDVFNSMQTSFQEYINTSYPGATGVYEKCNAYDRIDYTNTLQIINNFLNNEKKKSEHSK